MKLSFNTIHPCKVAYAVLLQLAEKEGGFDYIRGPQIGKKKFLDRLLERPELQELLSKTSWGSDKE